MKKMDFSNLKGINLPTVPTTTTTEQAPTEQAPTKKSYLVDDDSHHAACICQSCKVNKNLHEWDGQQGAIVVVQDSAWAAFNLQSGGYSAPQGIALFWSSQYAVPLDGDVLSGVYFGTVDTASNTCAVRLVSVHNVPRIEMDTPWGAYSVPDTLRWLPDQTIGVNRDKEAYRKKFGWARKVYEAWVQTNTIMPDSTAHRDWLRGEDGQSGSEAMIELLSSFCQNEAQPIEIGPFLFVPSFREFHKEVCLTIKVEHSPNSPFKKVIRLGYDAKNVWSEYRTWYKVNHYQPRSGASWPSNNDGMSFFDGRWVPDSEAGWCDPDWTSGD